jgi:hypothetical protein
MEFLVMSWPTLYAKAVNATQCGIVLASTIADAFGKSITADVCLSQGIVPLLANGKVATGSQVPVYVFASHVLTRHNRYNGNAPIVASVQDAWRKAGFTDSQRFGGGVTDKPAKAAALATRLASNPNLSAKAPKPEAAVKPVSKPASKPASKRATKPVSTPIVATGPSVQPDVEAPVVANVDTPTV